jgi:tetratricopeptide (TPR) repeat protein
VSQVYTAGTLERLASHDWAQVRRGAVLALGFLGDYAVNSTLGRALQDEDRTVRSLAEHSIRNVWTRTGTEKERRVLGLIVRLNSAQQFEAAIRRATELLEHAAWFGEVWNQRAIAYFSLGRYEETIRDCHQTLEINPYHFGAAAGMGQAYLELGNRDCALESFRRALRLYPDLEAVRVQVARLVRLPGSE